MSYVLKDRRGQRVGTAFDRYVDAFNHRASLNRPDLTVSETVVVNEVDWAATCERAGAGEPIDFTDRTSARAKRRVARAGKHA